MHDQWYNCCSYIIGEITNRVFLNICLFLSYLVMSLIVKSMCSPRIDVYNIEHRTLLYGIEEYRNNYNIKIYKIRIHTVACLLNKVNLATDSPYFFTLEQYIRSSIFVIIIHIILIILISKCMHKLM